MTKGRLRRKKQVRLAVYVIAFLIAAALHISTALYLSNDETGDGKIYSQMAVTLLEQGVFSVDTQPPYTPTLIRLPGYPIFLAGVYSVFGHGNNNAVRVVHAVIFTVTCLLAAFLAWNWVEGKKSRRRKAAQWAFFLTALCPFLPSFSGVILTEIVTMFFLVVMTLAATYGIKSTGRTASWVWWGAAGIISGISVFIRPDCGLFALGLGLTLVTSLLFKQSSEEEFSRRLALTVAKGALFSIAFILPLVPWTIRNERVFGVFQPLAPTHAEAPGEFVPRGYYLWVRTWINDQRDIPMMLWGLEQQRINADKIPASAFDSDEERSHVAVLIDQYNNSDPEHPMVAEQKRPNADSDDSDDSDTNDSDDNSDSSDNGDDQGDDQSDDSDQADQQPEELNLKISPDVDTAFAQIAQERIARHPIRFYLILPAERAASMWFDTHSDYYPFSGELFPTKDLDLEINQEFWLPLFAGIVWLYTAFAAAGAFFFWRNRRKRSRLWLLMILLLSVPRIAFFGTMENPEPRYLVELFLFAAILGGIALARVCLFRRDHALGLEVDFSKQ